MEYYVDNVLIAPGYLQSILLVNGNYIVRPSELPHSRQIHQHHSWIDPQLAIIWMLGESIVPTSVGILVLRTEGCQLTGVHLLEIVPDFLGWRQKQSVCIHVENRIRVIQYSLKHKSCKSCSQKKTMLVR